MLLVFILALTVVYGAALLALVRDATRLRRTITQLERRLAAAELEAATTVVIEPEPQPTQPRPRNVLIN